MTLLRRCGLIPIDGPGRSTHYGWSCHQSDHRPCVRNIGAMGRLSCHTVAHVSHRQHFGSGLFGGQGLRCCSALLGEASKLFRLSARHGPPHLVSYRSNPMRESRFRNQSGFSLACIQKGTLHANWQRRGRAAEQRVRRINVVRATPRSWRLRSWSPPDDRCSGLRW